MLEARLRVNVQKEGEAYARIYNGVGADTLEALYRLVDEVSGDWEGLEPYLAISEGHQLAHLLNEQLDSQNPKGFDTRFLGVECSARLLFLETLPPTGSYPRPEPLVCPWMEEPNASDPQ
jgi:hypothetical protein